VGDENVFVSTPARKKIASVFPPGKNSAALNETPGNNFPVPPSKWADLPELDLNSAAGAGRSPSAENLHRRHLTQLEREQKGERWSV
jgi:hypothetical protein